MRQFDTIDMASGGLALILEPASNCEQFPAFSKKWVNLLNAKALSNPVVSCDENLLDVQTLNGKFWITYDDFQSSIQLEPQNAKFNHIIIGLQKKLRNKL